MLRHLLMVVLLAAGTPALADKLPRLVLAGPSSSVSNPLIHMVESGALDDLADKVEFVSWRDPDQLRLLALNQQADVLAMPVNVAANLYNRGAKLRMLNVSSWGLLWLVSREQGLSTLDDLRGKEIAMPFRGDMPDILFGLLAERAGIDVRKDLRLRYVATPIDAMQLLLMRRTDHALLAEPAISMALRKASEGPLGLVAPDLYRSVDLQQEWGRLLQREARIPQAGIALMASVKDQPQIAARIAQAYADSLQWCSTNAERCGQLVATHLPMLSAEAVTDSLAVAQMDAVPAAEAQVEVEYLFELLLKKNPALIGGKLPADDFYSPVSDQP
jgi:NitT/TauT family transport system substrate-binding protein